MGGDMRTTPCYVIAATAAVFWWSTLAHPADFGARELLESVADSPENGALTIPEGISTNQIERAFVSLHQALMLNQLSGTTTLATLDAIGSFQDTLTKKQSTGLKSLISGFSQKLKSGTIKIDALAGLEPNLKLQGAVSAIENPVCVNHQIPWKHAGDMPRRQMGWGAWHMNTDFHRQRMGHEWWVWNSSLSRWGANLYMSRRYFQLRCLNDDNMADTMNLPPWFDTIIKKLPCRDESPTRWCPHEGIYILWNDQYWLAK